jgi:hypothetical protein
MLTIPDEIKVFESTACQVILRLGRSLAQFKHALPALPKQEIPGGLFQCLRILYSFNQLVNSARHQTPPSTRTPVQDNPKEAIGIKLFS